MNFDLKKNVADKVRRALDRTDVRLAADVCLELAQEYYLKYASEVDVAQFKHGANSVKEQPR